jgi:HPt (histidine-containing phosphotransfer) domain-containing protein
MTEGAAAEAVARLWERFRPLVSARIGTIEAYLEGQDGVGLEDAARAAHNLAGALGSYGRPDGSRVARRIEHALRAPDPAPPEQLREDVATLRAAVA